MDVHVVVKKTYYDIRLILWWMVISVAVVQTIKCDMRLISWWMVTSICWCSTKQSNVT